MSITNCGMCIILYNYINEESEWLNINHAFKTIERDKRLKRNSVLALAVQERFVTNGNVNAMNGKRCNARQKGKLISDNKSGQYIW